MRIGTLAIIVTSTLSGLAIVTNTGYSGVLVTVTLVVIMFVAFKRAMDM